jgi:ribosome production factor 2
MGGVLQMALKRPHAISFSKKNVIRPFEDPSSLEFWADKNDASVFVVGQSTKKRPNNLVLVRMFNNKLLDMCEVGVDKFVGMNEFKVLSLSWVYTYIYMYMHTLETNVEFSLG